MLDIKRKALVGAVTLAIAAPAAMAQMLEEVVVTAQKREQTRTNAKRCSDFYFGSIGKNHRKPKHR
jgi:uncharacterized low-complexity protein